MSDFATDPLFAEFYRGERRNTPITVHFPPKPEPMPQTAQQRPAQYEDQYGTMRWTHNGERV